jgi:hypothetical protein
MTSQRRLTYQDELVELMKANNRILEANRKSILELQDSFSEIKDLLRKIVINTS